jgi:hypothetical protein
LKIIFRIIYFIFYTNILFCLKGYGYFCVFSYFFFSKYSAWKVLKLCLYKDRSVLFWNQVLKYQLNFKSFKVISLFAYLGQLGVITSLFGIFSLLEFPFLSSIHSFCCYHMLSEQS